jgi:histidinol-phosphatase
VAGYADGVLDTSIAALEEELAFAHELADAADVISMDRFRARDLVVNAKPDLSPVTEADRGIEQLIRDLVASHRPSHAVLGEEFGGDPGATEGWRWVVDPIDGTKSFVRGMETWGTLIALQCDGRTVVAVASTPADGQRYAAVRGGGATANGESISVSGVTTVTDAMLAHSSVAGFQRVGLWVELLELTERVWEARGIGNTHSHLAVARGLADIGWTARANVWDYAALSLIVEEAGGRFLDRSGDGPLGGTGLSSNGLLHDEVLTLTGANRNRHP